MGGRAGGVAGEDWSWSTPWLRGHPPLLHRGRCQPRGGRQVVRVGMLRYMSTNAILTPTQRHFTANAGNPKNLGGALLFVDSKKRVLIGGSGGFAQTTTRREIDILRRIAELEQSTGCGHLVDVRSPPTRAERGQIRNHSRAARQCSIQRHVGINGVERAVSTSLVRILIYFSREHGAGVWGPGGFQNPLKPCTKQPTLSPSGMRSFMVQPVPGTNKTQRMFAALRDDQPCLLHLPCRLFSPEHRRKEKNSFGVSLNEPPVPVLSCTPSSRRPRTCTWLWSLSTAVRAWHPFMMKQKQTAHNKQHTTACMPSL